MNDLYDYEYLNDDEDLDMPSVNHSFLQGQLTGLFFIDDRFTPFVELSLDASQVDLSTFALKAKDELVPDVCLYEGAHQFEPSSDASKRNDMPLLAIEIVSPTQGAESILAKFKAYFALGIKSCWMIIPTNKAVTIYSASNQFKTFGTQDTEIIDEILDIRLPLQKIWGT